MSVEIEKKIIKTYASIDISGADTTIDNDIIVPDSQPDIKRVLQAQVLPMVCEKHIQKGYITLSGNMDYSILYLSDEKNDAGKLKSISARIPFSLALEAFGVENADFVGIKPEVVALDFSAVNSRKVNVKCSLDFSSNIICTDEYEAISSLSHDTELPCKTSAVRSFVLSEFSENEFELNSSFKIPSGSEVIDEILKVDVKTYGKEIKAINGKLVAKGSVDICALYTDTSGETKVLNGEMPFTEVLSVDSVSDSDICEVEYALTDFYYSADSDDDGDTTTINVRACVNASACVYAQRTEDIYVDMYSPHYEIDISKDTMSCSKLICNSGETINVKEMVEIDADSPQISKIYNVIVEPFINTANVAEGKAEISGVSDVYIQYISPSDEIKVHSHKKEVPFALSTPVEDGEDFKISVVCNAYDILFNTLSSNSAEVRFNLDCDTKVIGREKIAYIKDVEICENTDCHKARTSQITIYFAQKGESMWDIAKKYRTTLNDIKTANHTDFPDILTEDRKIMIP